MDYEETWIMRVLMATYSGSWTSVNVNGVLSEEFEVKMGVHEGLALSSLLFVVLEAVSQT